MPTAADIIAEALRWVGTTRFVHQASVRGVGADCTGFLVGVARETGAVPREALDALPRDYSRLPSNGALQAIVARVLDEIQLSEMRPADIVLFAIEGEVRHAGLLTDYGVVHTLPGELGVRHHRLDSLWRGRIRFAYRFRGLNDVR